MTISETEFKQLADAAFARIETLLDDHDVDYEWRGEVLEIELADGSLAVLNRHLPNRELWLAARSGAFHFSWQENVWRDTRDGMPLFDRLRLLLAGEIAS